MPNHGVDWIGGTAWAICSPRRCQTPIVPDNGSEDTSKEGPRPSPSTAPCDQVSVSIRKGSSLVHLAWCNLATRKGFVSLRQHFPPYPLRHPSPHSRHHHEPNLVRIMVADALRSTLTQAEEVRRKMNERDEDSKAKAAKIDDLYAKAETAQSEAFQKQQAADVANQRQTSGREKADRPSRRLRACRAR
ncbi:hypothetical protein B0T21DRAFT_413518 [Apiosordaria backusii]|uniref:Uncharacterized protein n=1 Tax=Apiosordaria backusii TaxID=314023 RepID=A0AA40B1Z3_9PEZI|nr:hypothetical protein B0T21DRAFT_413518 [Apiosordaria backusii]